MLIIDTSYIYTYIIYNTHILRHEGRCPAKEMIDMQLITAIEQELIVARLCLMAADIFIFLLNINAICPLCIYIYIKLSICKTKTA